MTADPTWPPEAREAVARAWRERVGPPVVGDMRHQARIAERHFQASYTHAEDALAALTPFLAAMLTAALAQEASRDGE